MEIYTRGVRTTSRAMAALYTVCARRLQWLARDKWVCMRFAVASRVAGVCGRFRGVRLVRDFVGSLGLLLWCVLSSEFD